MNPQQPVPNSNPPQPSYAPPPEQYAPPQVQSPPVDPSPVPIAAPQPTPQPVSNAPAPPADDPLFAPVPPRPPVQPVAPSVSFDGPDPVAPVPGQQVQPQQPPLLADVVNNAHEVLCKATTVFPFVLFPDTIVVDREKVTITHTSFFKTGDMVSTSIDDILSVSANVGPLFGSLRLTIRNVPQQNPPEIKYLSRKDVIDIKNILQGYIIARQNNVDCASLPKQELIALLQRLGSGKGGAP